MEQLSLFDADHNNHQKNQSKEYFPGAGGSREIVPLAQRMRPESVDEIAGQQHLLGPGKLLRRLIETDQISSMIFWGPPGVGKTTIASVIAETTHSNFVNFSAVTSGIKEIKEVMAEAEASRRRGVRTVLFVDEIHRFNKAQQDAFLPYVERGSITLIGATTENPSFEINAALLSRCKVFVLKALTADEIMKLLKRALTSPKGLGHLVIDIDDELLYAIATFANGDARTALGTLEMAVMNGEMTLEKTIVTKEIVEQVTSRKSLLYDKGGEEHYNIISALHKSMRNSDPDAAVYWLARMLEAGEEPLYVARRVIRFASEDVGLADPQALPLAVAAYQACHYIGMPECTVNLTQAVIYMAMAPKSNACEVAYMEAAKDAQESMAEPVPLHIRNAPTKLMEDLDYGKGYEYAHNYEEKMTKMKCLPESLDGKEYYRPYGLGREKEFRTRLEEIKEFKKA